MIKVDLVLTPEQIKSICDVFAVPHDVLIATEKPKPPWKNRQEKRNPFKQQYIYENGKLISK